MKKRKVKIITIDEKEANITHYVKESRENTELSYEGYELKWEDQFEGSSLNRDDWNVELHDPGWVNFRHMWILRRISILRTVNLS